VFHIFATNSFASSETIYISVLQCVAMCCSVLPTHTCVPHLRNKVLHLITNYSFNIHQCVAVCSSVLQCFPVCCSVLQCVALAYVCSTSSKQSPSPPQKLHLPYTSVCCSVLQCVAVCCTNYTFHIHQCIAVCCSVLQCVAVCCSVLQCVAQTTPSIYISALQCVAVCCSMMQCVPIQTHSNLRKKVLRLIRNYNFHIHQCVAICCNVLQCVTEHYPHTYLYSNLRNKVLRLIRRYNFHLYQFVAVCCSVLQCVAVRHPHTYLYSNLQNKVLRLIRRYNFHTCQCVASVLQCVTHTRICIQTFETKSFASSDTTTSSGLAQKKILDSALQSLHTENLVAIRLFEDFIYHKYSPLLMASNIEAVSRPTSLESLFF